MMTTQSKLESRAFAGEADLPAIRDLLNLCDALDRLDDSYSLDSLRRRLAEPTSDPALDLRLWEDAQGRLVGFGQLWHPPPEPADTAIDAGIYFRVHPGMRNEGLEDVIIAWGAARARQLGQAGGRPAVLGAGMRQTRPEYVAYRRPILERNGFIPVHYSYLMARALAIPIPEPRVPAGFTVRLAQGEADWVAWVEAFNEAYRNHWKFHPWTLEQHRHWVSSPQYRPDLDLVASAPDGTLAAFCMGRIDAEANARSGRKEGRITDLGTRPGYRGQGLGRALLLTGLHRLHAAGLDTALLDVDAENPTGARRVYDMAGFAPRITTISYRKDV